MKSGSVASVAVLLGLGVLAGVSFVRERSAMVMSEDNLGLSSLKKVARQKKKRVKAVVEKLELDDDRDLYRLYDYIMDQEYNEECQSDGKSCSMIAISFTVGSESDAGSNHDLKYESFNGPMFKFVPKNPGETDMKAKKIDFPSDEKFKLEISYWIIAKGTNAAKVRINWLMNRVWNAGANRNEYLVSVAANNEGFNCYSRQIEYIGTMYCHKGYQFSTDSASTYPWNHPYSDPWDAFDNAVTSKRGRHLWGNLR